MAFDAYFVDENNVIYGMNDGTKDLAGIPLSGVYPGGQDWDSSGTEANLTIATMFKDYEKYIIYRLHIPIQFILRNIHGLKHTPAYSFPCKSL